MPKVLEAPLTPQQMPQPAQLELFQQKDLEALDLRRNRLEIAATALKQNVAGLEKYDAKQFGEALVDFRSADKTLGDKPDTVIATNVAHASYQLAKSKGEKNFEEAKAQAFRALKLDGNNAYAHNVLGAIAAEEGDLNGAAMHVAEAMKNIGYLDKAGAEGDQLSRDRQAITENYELLKGYLPSESAEANPIGAMQKRLFKSVPTEKIQKLKVDGGATDQSGASPADKASGGAHEQRVEGKEAAPNPREKLDGTLKRLDGIQMPKSAKDWGELFKPIIEGADPGQIAEIEKRISENPNWREYSKRKARSDELDAAKVEGTPAALEREGAHNKVTEQAGVLADDVEKLAEALRKQAGKVAGSDEPVERKEKPPSDNIARPQDGVNIGVND